MRTKWFVAAAVWAAWMQVPAWPGVSFAGDFHWIGAGTGGNTATDPADPTTQWDNADNWLEGTIPGTGDTAYISLTNRGYCNVMSGTGAQIIWVEVEGITPEGALHIGEGMDFQVERQEYIANRATGKIVQTGGTHRISWGAGHVWLYLGYQSGSSGTYELGGGEFTVDSTGVPYAAIERIGENGRGTFVQTGGRHSVQNMLRPGHGELHLGYGVGSSGLYSLANGDLSVDEVEYIGRSGTGAFIQAGGTNTTGMLYVGWGDLGVGSYELNGGQLSVNGSETIGPRGQGTFVQTGGTNTAEDVYVSQSAYSTGTYELRGDGSLSADTLTMASYSYYSTTVIADFSIAESGDLTVRSEVIGEKGHAFFAQSGGSHTVTGTMTLGYESTGRGTYELTDGSLNTGGIALGLNGTGSLTQSGGTHNVAGELHLGHNSGSEGVYDLSDGELTVGTSEYIGLRGTGTMTLSGGTHTVAEMLHLGYDADSSGTLALAGGSLSAAEMYVGTLGYGELKITDASAEVEISEKLAFGASSRFAAAPSSEIHMTGAALENESTDPVALGDLDKLTLIFEGGTQSVDPFEVAGEDMGPVIEGWTSNFALGTLTLGGADVGWIRLVDDFDNQPNWEGREALYVDSLLLNPGAAIDLNGLNLYYRNSGAPTRLLMGDANLDGLVEGSDYTLWADHYEMTGMAWGDGDFNGDGFVGGGDYTIWADNYAPAVPGGAVPEPATLALLGIGALGLAHRRRWGRFQA